MQDQINIRDAVRKDAPKLIQFGIAMALETEDKQLDDQTVTSGVNAVFDNPSHGFYMVAEVDGKAAGSLKVTTEWSEWRDGDYWWIQSVYVEPEFRCHGIFRAMYAEITKRAKYTPNVCGCRLYVERDNAAAQETYVKLGFVETTYKMFEEFFPD